VERQEEQGMAGTVRGERKPRADGIEARARILDSAESLFSERGFYGTSVRDLTEHAGVRLASVNYHFTSKETLFRDVLVRRADVLGRERLALLARLPRRGTQAVRSRALVHAFVAPVAARAVASAGWRNYLSLIAQVSSSRLPALSLVADRFNPVALRFIAALGAIFPRCPRRALHHAYQFMLASTLYAFAGNQRLESLTRGALRSDDFASIEHDLIGFLAAGLLALCTGRRAPTRLLR
jgi:AcrR family transcriptional regulator